MSRNLRALLDERVRAAMTAAGVPEPVAAITPAARPEFGDYQANAAMGLAKTLAEKTGVKTNPRAVAEQIKAKLDLGAIAQEISIAGPGFINVRLHPKWLSEQTQSIANDPRLGIIPRDGAATRVVVDYSGPNIAKQMHVGHLRSTIIGDAIARTLDFVGHAVGKIIELGGIAFVLEGEDGQQAFHNCPSSWVMGGRRRRDTWRPSQLRVRPTEGEV